MKMSQSRDSVSGNSSSGRSRAESAFSGVRYLIKLQLFVKLVTFLMNIAIVYLAGRDAFGIASVKFELILSTILFLSREGIRNALLRVENPKGIVVHDDSKVKEELPRNPPLQDQLVINASLVSIALGITISAGLYIYMSARGGIGSEETVYIIAACIELCVEPLFIMSRVRVLFKLQAKCEAIAVAGRCITVFLVLLIGRYNSDDSNNNPFGLIAFAIGQLTYAISILLAFSWYMSAVLKFSVWSCYIPRPIVRSGNGYRDGMYIDRATGRLVATFFGQLILKHFLTQGDNMILARYADDKTMGVFALVSKYGSIPANIIFFPLEEASRAVFSELSSIGGEKSSNSIALSSEQLINIRSAGRVLTVLGKMQLLFGMLITVFGTLYLPVLFSIAGMGGDTTMVSTARAYCLYVPLMGLNGFLEAFVHTVATSTQLVRMNLWMAGVSLVYAASAVYMLSSLGFGSAGIVVANMLNMSLRIMCSWIYISQWFSHNMSKNKPSIALMLPNVGVLGTCVLSGTISVLFLWFVGLSSSLYLQGLLLFVGSLLGTSVLASIFYCEKPFLDSVRDIHSGRAAYKHHLKRE